MGRRESYRFDAGKLTAINCPIDHEDGEDLSEALRRNGYSQEHTVIDNCGCGLEMWTHNRGGQRHVLVVNTIDYWSDIYVTGFINLVYCVKDIRPLITFLTAPEVERGA